MCWRPWDFPGAPGDIVPHLSAQGALTLPRPRARLKKGVVVAYRAGDQPNNAFSLNVLNPGSGDHRGDLRRGVRRHLGGEVRPQIQGQHVRGTSCISPAAPRYGVLLLRERDRDTEQLDPQEFRRRIRLVR